MLTQIQLIIEIVLSFFLLLGIIYSFYLSRILSNLKHDRESLMGLVEKLEASVKSAEEGVEKLRVAGEVSGRPLNRMIELAKVTSTELGTMVGKADATADRLETATIKASPHEKKLERLLEKASEIELKQNAEARSSLAADGMQREAATMPPVDARESNSESAPSLPQDTAPTNTPSSTDDAPLRATREEGGTPRDWSPDAPSAQRTTAPSPTKGSDGSKNARTGGSARQKNQQLKRFENTFLSRPSR